MVALCAGVAVVLGVKVLLAPGPVKAPPNATVHGVSVKSGQSVTWGGAYLLNTTDRPVVVRRVELVRRTDAEGSPSIDRMEVLDPSTAANGIGTAEGDGYSTIPASLRHRVDGFTIAPERYGNFLVRMTARSPGIWRIDALRVSYSVGGSTYEVELPQAFVLCVDVAGTCPTR